MKRHRLSRAASVALGVGIILALADPGWAGAPNPPKVPAAIKVIVAPEPARPGEAVTVELALEPIDGVKINRYPQITLDVPARAGMFEGSRVVLGDSTPPPVERMQSNYFEKVEPLRLALALALAAQAPAGRHEVEAKLTYFYCMPASGFCAPARVPVTIPLEIR
jgi:hypothetical protein